MGHQPVVGSSSEHGATKPEGKDAGAVGVATTSVPISKRSRPWKAPRNVRTSTIKNPKGSGLTWEQKMAQREKRQVLQAAVRAAREEDQAAKDAERKRRYEKRKQKEENEMRSAKKVMITNPKKLAKMSKKQFLKHVHSKK